MNSKLKIFAATAACALALGSASAQEASSLYYMRNNPLRSTLNPAWQPMQDIYVDLPIIPAFYLGENNNSVRYKDVVYPKWIGGDRKTITFLNKEGDKDKFYDKLKYTTRFKQELRVDILSFGFRKNQNYFSFGISEREEIYAKIPRHALQLGLYGTATKDGVNHFDFSNLDMRAQAWTEFALGFSRELNDKWTVGGKAKFLVGEANLRAKFAKFKLDASRDYWDTDIDGRIDAAIPGATYGLNSDGKLNDLDVSLKHTKAKDYIQGYGFAVDLGATFKPIDHLTLSASVTDLGFLRWKKDVVNVKADGEYHYEGIDYDVEDRETNYWTKYFDELKDNVDYKTKLKRYNSMLSAKVHLGAEYGILDDKITFGLLSKTAFFQKSLYEDLTASVNFLPKDWFDFTLSYTLLGGEYSDFGAAIGARASIFYIWLASDFIPMSYTKQAIPHHNKEVNLSFGLMMTFNNKDNKDSDHDGVKDKKDKCPDTPEGWQVDKFGCPVDTDGDGVPDNFDECPDTPKEARGHVDEKGCPKDTDGDGVPDYLDECPNTPAGVQVDEKGCPLDSDGDGVPDYLDKCPGTPKEAYGMVDENGCPKDSDGDGVPDYLDKCPGTPAAARGYVDENGCPKDTDGDGVPDYLDACPTVPGIPENNGCPEVKAEVKKLFQQALTGIQFETGKDVIRPVSYGILNNVVDVMKMNPEYKLNIIGHTDNTGDKDKNQVLSEKRAAAVKKYLEDKGIDASRLTSEGKGQDQPVADNKTAAGRQQNRRVEFVVNFEKVVTE